MTGTTWTKYLANHQAAQELVAEGCDSWDEGGCLTLATGLAEIAAKADIAAQVVYLVDAEGTTQHAVLQVGEFYIDETGKSTSAALLRRWARRAGVIAIAVDSKDCSIPVYDAVATIAADAKLATMLAAF